MLRTNRFIGMIIAALFFAFMVIVPKGASAEATVELMHPDDGTTASAQESVYGSVSQAPTSVVVKYKASGGSWTTACNGAIQALDWDCTWPTGSLASGTYSLRADAVVDGVTYSSNTVSVVVSNAAPATTATPSTAKSSTTTKTATPRASASAAAVSPSVSPSVAVSASAVATADTKVKGFVGGTWFWIIILAGAIVILGVVLFILKRRGAKGPQ